jgi:hypothetical protein
MQNLISIIFVGLFVYLMFIRKGGMGCCGGHGNRNSGQDPKVNMGKSSHADGGDVIDLRKDEYTILPTKKRR